MESHCRFILEGADARTAFFLRHQTLEEGDYLGTAPPEYPGGRAAARPTAGAMANALCCLVHPESAYCRDPLLLERLLLAEGGIRANLRPSGCLDLENCNFDTAPDTAFAILELAPAYRVLAQFTEDGEYGALKERLSGLLRTMADGVRAGGFHTPNHRWAIASALALCANLFGAESYRARALDYLGEGVDCNEDGEYSERSTGVYNTVNNSTMITLAQELGDPAYLEHVRRNLHMMLCYLEPDGSVFTQNSTRQDKGQRAWPIHYYWQYRLLADHYGDDTLAAAAARILEDCRSLGLWAAPPCLDKLMLRPALQADPAAAPALPTRFNRHFEASGIVRYRSGSFGYSLLRDSSRFFFFQTGEIGFYLRLGVGYFEKRHVKADRIVATDNGYCFDFHGDGWYYLPFGQVEEDIVDFFQADNEKREKLIANTTDLHVEVVHAENGVDLVFRSQGIDRVAYLLEIVLPPGLPVETEALYAIPGPGEGALLKSGTLAVKGRMDTVTIGPMRGDRNLLHGNHGSDPRDRDGYTVYNTFVTNFDHRLQIRSL